jgi:NADPH:quinone reductase-like Zn-dependent oxidoreductase
MKAAVYRTYGPPEVQKIEDVEQPSIGDDDRVLIKVHAASVNPSDTYFRKGHLLTRLDNGFRKPSVCPRQSVLSLMPQNATFREAAATPCVALTALQALRDVAHIQPGQKVLIYGASGGIGQMAVQLANVLGAEVTAVCSTSNVPWVKELGPDDVIDYTREDFADNGKQYDLILDAVGRRIADRVLVWPQKTQGEGRPRNQTGLMPGRSDPGALDPGPGKRVFGRF